MQGLKYISWADNTGYAVAAKSYLRVLEQAGVALSWVPMLPGPLGYELRQSVPGELGRLANRAIDYDTVLIHTVPEYFPNWIDRERHGGRRVLGYTVWELDHLPGHWPAILNRLDGVIVPCSFNVEVFRRSGVTVPIHVVPHLSQFEHGAPANDADRAALRRRIGERRLAADPFIVYTIGFWSNRKAPYLALEAYRAAFAADEPVLMVLKTSGHDFTRLSRHWRNLFRRRHPTTARSAAALLRRAGATPPVVVIGDDTLTEGQIRALHELGDCYVSLARAEGWGLGTFDAAWHGNPVVTTAWGGQLDFLDPALTGLVDYEMVPVDEPVWWASYPASERWAQPSVADAARKLRQAFDDRAAVAERARRQAAGMRERFSAAATTAALLRALA